MSGGAIGFYSGDVHWLTDDMKLLKPTFVPTVPKFFNRLYSKVSNSHFFSKITYFFTLRILYHLKHMFNHLKLSGCHAFEPIQSYKTYIQFGDKKEIKGNVDRIGENYSFSSMN